MPRRIFDGSETEFIDWKADHVSRVQWLHCAECNTYFPEDRLLIHYQEHADADAGDDVDRKVAEERG
jgi:hypothetical protein